MKDRNLKNATTIEIEIIYGDSEYKIKKKPYQYLVTFRYLSKKSGLQEVKVLNKEELLEYLNNNLK